jgi:uncharacterized protein (TIGR02246 family)
MARRLLAVLGTALMMACQAPAASPVDATSAIAEQNKKFSAAVTAKDAAAIAALYAEDATLLPPNAPAAQGRTAIQAYWQAFLDAGVTNGTLTSSQVTNTATDATEVGTWVIRAPDGSVADNGKYIVWWKKVGDTWHFYRDIFNSDRPATPAAK